MKKEKAKIKIVIVDDEEDLCFFVKEWLDAQGEFEVITTTKADIVEKLCKKERPDIILLDVVMPTRKVEPIIEFLKNDSDTKGTPIIIMSGLGEMVYLKEKANWEWMPNSQAVQSRGKVPDDRIYWKAAEAYGVDDYIKKPFDPETLVEVIKEVLKKKKER